MAYHANWNGTSPPHLFLGNLRVYWLGPSWYRNKWKWVFSAQRPFIGERIGSINILWIEISY